MRTLRPKLGVFWKFWKNTQLWVYGAHPRLLLKSENLFFGSLHTKINRNMWKEWGKKQFLADFEWGFEKKICHFLGAKCHIKLNHAIYMDICFTFINPLLHGMHWTLHSLLGEGGQFDPHLFNSFWVACKAYLVQYYLRHF